MWRDSDARFVTSSKRARSRRAIEQNAGDARRKDERWLGESLRQEEKGESRKRDENHRRIADCAPSEYERRSVMVPVAAAMTPSTTAMTERLPDKRWKEGATTSAVRKGHENLDRGEDSARAPSEEAAFVGGLLWQRSPALPFFIAAGIGVAGTLVFIATVNEQNAG